MKMLVTTDFSVNSKGAIRFVLNLAKKSEEIEVVFYHSVYIIKPIRWNDHFYDIYKHEEIERLTTELKKFVYAIIGEENKIFSNIKFVVDTATSTKDGIIKYAEKSKMDMICIATKGAGLLRKIIGTHTEYIVNNSKKPVIVIPSHYRIKPLKKALYLTDFDNVKSEIDKVVTFTSEIKCSLGVLHFSSIVLDINKFKSGKELFNSYDYKNIKLNIVKSNLESSLVESVSRYVDKSRPELLIMFTNRERGFFESIFLPSKTSELTYTTKVPVLVFPK